MLITPYLYVHTRDGHEQLLTTFRPRKKADRIVIVKMLQEMEIHTENEHILYIQRTVDQGAWLCFVYELQARQITQSVLSHPPIILLRPI